MIYTNFSIFKAKEKKNEKSPDYNISAKDESGKFIKIGVAWRKQMANGDTYLSCRLDENPYKPQNTQPDAPQNATGLSPEEVEAIKKLKQAEIDRANGELNIIAEEQFNDW